MADGRHRPSFCVAELALVARLVPVVAAALCVAGVALASIHLHSVWQAWQLATSIFTLCGRRGTYGTGLAWVPFDAVVTAAVCVAGVALGDIDLHFGAWRHQPSLCVAGL